MSKFFKSVQALLLVSSFLSKNFFAVLEFAHRIFCFLGRHLPHEPHSQPFCLYLFFKQVSCLCLTFMDWNFILHFLHSWGDRHMSPDQAFTGWDTVWQTFCWGWLQMAIHPISTFWAKITGVSHHTRVKQCYCSIIPCAVTSASYMTGQGSVWQLQGPAPTLKLLTWICKFSSITSKPCCKISVGIYKNQNEQVTSQTSWISNCRSSTGDTAVAEYGTACSRAWFSHWVSRGISWSTP
jgi:hypothetical protein